VQAVFPLFDYFPPQLAVNDAGVIVGQGFPLGGGARGAAKWSNPSGYAFLGGHAARAVNAAGVIVGLYQGNASTPFIWRETTGMEFLSGFEMPGGSDAFDINDFDVVVGRAGANTCSGNGTAFRWTEADGVLCLPKVYLAAAHEALAISNNGRVVGRFHAEASTPFGAFMWTAGTGTVDLHAPAGQAFFMDVNDAGDVVLTIVPPGGGTTIPYLYRNGTWTNINTLLPAGAPIVLKTVTGINANGWMVGDAATTANPNASGIGWLLIPPAATTTTVTSASNPSQFGTTATFTATVRNGGSAVTTGTVTFREGGTVLAGPIALDASGQATFATAALGVGSHTVEAAFSGATGFFASTGTVTHHVLALPPTSQADTYATQFETTLTVSAPGVLVNDATNGGGTMTAVLDTTVSHGTLSLAATGGFVYTPNAGFAGSDSFMYHASNSAGAGNAVTVSITVELTTPQPPTGLYVSAIAGNEVTFRWTPPAIGPTPEEFVLTGGLGPGEVLAAIATGSTYPIFTVTAPNGAFYVRMQTVVNGSTSTASNEIRVFVNTGTPPSAPVDLVALVNGSAVGLTWRNTFGGGAPTSMLLNVTGTVTATIPLSLTESFAFTPVPAGTYTFSVSAVNADGMSPPSPAVTLTFPGPCTGIPLPPANVLAYRSGNTIGIVWDSAPSGPAPSNYVLSVTGSYVGTVTTTARRLSGAVGPGSYGLSLHASNACGTSVGTPVQTILIP
jgi:probable HAF family extracellular repeat protein